MPDDTNKTLRSLHDLVATCNDAAEGYGKAAKGVHDKGLSDRLALISGERMRFVADLERVLSAIEGQNTNDLHEGGILHTGWVDLETRIRPKEQHEILRECVSGDEGTLKHYRHALDQELSPVTRTLVADQHTAVERDLQFLRASLQKHVARA